MMVSQYFGLVTALLLCHTSHASILSEEWVLERDADGSKSVTLDEFLKDETSQLQQPQIDTITKTFNIVDSDGDGLLSLGEIRGHYFLRPQNTDEHISRADRDSDGALSSSEFVNFETAVCVLESERWNGQTRACYDNRPNVQESFKWMDENKDGSLDRIELERAVYANRANHHQLPVTAEDYIKAQDTNDDGHISLQETLTHGKAQMQKMADQLFKFIDKNGDGQIVEEEIESRVEMA